LGHRLLTDGCIDAEPRENTYTAADLVTSLQAGVRVGAPGGAARVSGELVKKIKFGAPTQHSVPTLDLTFTGTCEAKLRRLPETTLRSAYVVQEVLRADIAEQTCGRLDASGRMVGLGSAEAALAAACSQVSLEPVAVGYRTVPVARLLGLPETTPTAASSAGAPVAVAAVPDAEAPAPAPERVALPAGPGPTLDRWYTCHQTVSSFGGKEVDGGASTCGSARTVRACS
jgi:hypothetical protein